MDENTPSISLVSCMHFVRRGVAKAVPEKIELTEEDLEKIIKQTADDLKLTENSDDDDEDGGEGSAPPPTDPNDEFNFEKYDEEENSNPIGLGTIATVPNLGDLSEDVQIKTDGPDSDEEDDIIKPNDNLLLVGHVESDASILEVYIFNKEEDSFYVHHDMLLPWFPLCIEWLSHDPTDPNPGNLCAVGGMDPIILVWDLDIENCLEPAFKLGKKPSRKKNIARVGHSDAVLDLSWNKNFTHVLASGSADNTVLLWDLDKGAPHTKFDYYQDKVQSLCFHPLEAQTLLSGACDGAARVADCREPGLTPREWRLPGEIERVTWDIHNPFCFAMSNNLGEVAYVDCRHDEPVWRVQAHEKEVTGLIINDNVPGMMITAGTDGKLKTWDISNGATQVSEKTTRVGQTLCMALCPDDPFSVAYAGDNKQCYIETTDLTISEQVMHRFGSRPLVSISTENTESMET
ncbi:periodic tryptophan protein 1 homolog [Leptidea sinapis]|uniref:periodic tryptophan protein 1 homolog n=1 Tax=Leptidea sinapis TaxID=189913 RepID=UPI0021256681|nr:periodic tryptophan protein 1 homolog [Leptidea sinapis]